MPRRTRLVLGTASLLIAGLSLTACGGGAKSGSATPSASSSSSASSTATRQGGAGGLFANAQVQQCLKAAGITLPTPTGSRPNRPSGSFTPGERPSDRPTGSFTRGAGGFGGGFFGADPAQAQAIQAALKACGITLPTGRRPGSSSSGAAPTATPTPSV
jgi:hypothetical protein